MATHPANGSLHGPGITRISVTGFKSLANKTDVEIRPLTVLAGANSSGKSALMQPLLLMKQTLESTVVPAGPFLLSGPYVQYTETKQFLSRASGTLGSRDRMDIDLGLGRRTSVGMTYGVDPGGTFDVLETRGTNPDPWEIRRDSSPDYLKRLCRQSEAVLAEKGLTDYSVVRSGFYQQIQVSTPPGLVPALRDLRAFVEFMTLISELGRVIYVRGLRGEPGRRFLKTEIGFGGLFVGPFDLYVPSLIEEWQQSGFMSSNLRLIEELQLLDLASGIRPLSLNESELELYVPRTRNSGDSDLVNIADVGLAVPIVLPVLVALIQADPGQLVYIEQPELHLHPRAQWKLAQLLVQAANRGVRLVIETHSSLLLQGILTCVAKGEITPETVALHWFVRDEDGVTRVKTADLDSEGRVGDWPVDFDDVELEATNRYLDAVELKPMAGRGAG